MKDPFISLIEMNQKYAELILNDEINTMKLELNYLQSFEMGDGRKVVYLDDVINLLDSFKKAEDDNNE